MLTMRHMYSILQPVMNLNGNFVYARHAKRDREIIIKQKSFCFQSHCLSAHCWMRRWRLSRVIEATFWRRKGGLVNNPDQGKGQIRAEESRTGSSRHSDDRSPRVVVLNRDPFFFLGNVCGDVFVCHNCRVVGGGLCIMGISLAQVLLNIL